MTELFCENIYRLKSIIFTKKPHLWCFRSSHQTCSMKKGILRNFAKFTGKHLCQSLFFNKVAGLRYATLLKKRLWHMCFPVNFAKFLGTLFFYRTPLDDCFWCLIRSYLTHSSVQRISDIHYWMPMTYVLNTPQLTFTCSKLTIETLEKSVKYGQSWQ